MKNGLKNVHLRLPTNILVNLLDQIVEQLMPEEYKAGTVKVHEFDWPEDWGRDNNGNLVIVPMLSVYITWHGYSLKCREDRRYTLLELTQCKEDESFDISVSTLYVTNWVEGTMMNQSFLHMKACLIANKFTSVIREHLKDR